MSLWPGQWLIRGSIFFLGLGVLCAFVPAVSVAFPPLAVIAALAVAIDLVWPGWSKPLHMQRTVPENVAVGVAFDGRIEVENHGRRPRRVEIFEGVPERCRSDDFPR